MISITTHTITYAPLTVQTEKEELERRHAEARAALRNHDHDLHKASVTVVSLTQSVADKAAELAGMSKAEKEEEKKALAGEQGQVGKALAAARDKVNALAEPLKEARGAAEKQGERLRALQTEAVRADAPRTSVCCVSACAA